MPRYLVWVSVRQFYLCDSLAQACNCKRLFGGLIYEPLAMSAAEKVHAEREDWEQFANPPASEPEKPQ